MFNKMINKIKKCMSEYALRGRKGLRRTLTAYRMLCDAAGICNWDMDVDIDKPIGSGNVVIWSPQFRKMLGFESEKDFPNLFSSLYNRIHPDDKKDALNALHVCIDDYTGTKQLNTEYRVMKQNGEYGYFRISGTILRNSKGFPGKLMGVMVDVTDKYQLDDLNRIHFEGIERKQRTLESLNDLGNMLLITSKSTFDKTLKKCMGTIGEILKADRVQIWRNEMVGTDLHFSLSNEWLSDLGIQLAATSKNAATYPYKAVPGWEEKLKRGRFINNPINDLLPHEYAFFNRMNVKSLVVVPLFENNNFRGFLRIDDCREKRVLSDEEMIDVNMMGQFIAFSQIANEYMREANVEINKINELTNWHHSVLDAMPMPVFLIDVNMNLIYINNAAEGMTGKSRENVYGKHCSTLGTVICNTPQCGIACARKFVNRTYFKNFGKYYQVDVTVLKNNNGETIGHVEVMQDLTSFDNRTGYIKSEQGDGIKISQ